MYPPVLAALTWPGSYPSAAVRYRRRPLLMTLMARRSWTRLGNPPAFPSTTELSLSSRTDLPGLDTAEHDEQVRVRLQTACQSHLGTSYSDGSFTAVQHGNAFVGIPA